MFSEKELSRELLLRFKAREDIRFFIKYMRRSHNPDFQYPPAQHHNLIIDDLHEIEAGHLPKIAISLPPGSAKSHYCSVIFPTWLLSKDPTLKILCVSASEGLAEKFSRQRRTILRSEEWQKISKATLSIDAQSLNFQGTNKGGGIYSAGQGSSIQGLRCNFLISDDLISGFEVSNSINQLEKIWSWYLSEARSRLLPNGAELIIATRWAVNDPIGKVLKLTDQGYEDWKYIRIPMLADRVDDPIGRNIGDMLWPEWFTENMLEDAKRDPAIFNCLYQQNPMTESGEWCNEECILIKNREEVPQLLKYVIGVDIALSISAKSDFTVFAVLAIDKLDKVYLVDLYRNQDSPEKTSAQLVKWSKRYKPSAVYIENDNTSKVWAKLVWQESRQQGVAVPLKLIPMGNKDKETRAVPLRTYLLHKNFVICQDIWTNDVLDEFNSFPTGTGHDDIVDACSVAAGELFKLSRPKDKIIKEVPVEPQIGMNSRGQMVVNSTLTELFDQKEHTKALSFSRKRI